MDEVFRALADPTRRYLLDLLREQTGQTLGELCARLDMTRQSATQHLAVLEAANLISTVRRGREKLHYLNPVPLHEMQERWIDKFERPRLRVLSAVKRQAEDTMSDRPTFVYTTYIESTPEKVWHALTDAGPDRRSIGGTATSRTGRSARAGRTCAPTAPASPTSVGEVLVSDPPHRLVTTWDESRVTFDLEPFHDIVKLTVTHEDLATEQDRADVAARLAGRAGQPQDPAGDRPDNVTGTVEDAPMTTLGAIFLPQNPPETLRSVARAADEAGLEELWLWEDCFLDGGLSAAAAALAWTSTGPDRCRHHAGPVPQRRGRRRWRWPRCAGCSATARSSGSAMVCRSGWARWARGRRSR